MNLSRLAPAAGVALLAAFTIATPGSALDAMGIVARSQAADKSVSYKGTKYADVSVGSATIRAKLRVLHKRPDRTRTEYISPRQISGIVTVTGGQETRTYSPATRRWDRSAWSPVPRSTSLALSNYYVSIAGTSKIAGRATYMVKLIPRKPGNPSETIWIDKRTYLPLRTELRNSSGVVISTSEFRDIAFGPNGIPDSAFKAGRMPALPLGSSGRPDPPSNLGFTIRKPGYVPKGYIMVQTAIIKIGAANAAHLMYSNGINTISIFERLRSSAGEQSPPGFGKWANVIRFDAGRITITIISDISRKELLKMAYSIK